MINKADLVECEVEGMGFVDLGDAAEETKQQYPAEVFPDSIFGRGWSCCR